MAVAVIEDDRGRVLLARRAVDTHQGGLWEFPGGKLDAGEDVSRALIRECREELGIEVVEHRPLIRITHHYPDRSVLLDVHKVMRFHGEAQGMEGQPLVWAEHHALNDYPMPAADRPIVNAIKLPSRYLITPAEVGERQIFLQRLQRSLEQGSCLVQFRVSGMNAADLEVLARDALALCQEMACPLLVNTDVELALRIGAAGVHLKSRQLQALKERPTGLDWIAASCHTRADLARAAELDLDFAVLSPVLPTASHPEVSPLGWRNFQQMADEALVPLFALGGMNEGHLTEAWQAGAQGIAAIRGLWNP